MLVDEQFVFHLALRRSLSKLGAQAGGTHQLELKVPIAPTRVVTATTKLTIRLLASESATFLARIGRSIFKPKKRAEFQTRTIYQRAPWQANSVVVCSWRRLGRRSRKERRRRKKVSISSSNGLQQNQ